MKSTNKTPAKEKEITQTNNSDNDLLQSPTGSTDIREIIERASLDDINSPIRAMPLLIESKEDTEEIIDEKFLTSFDDSSDEDEDDIEIPKYNVVEKWKLFLTALPTFNIDNVVDSWFYYQYPFLSHALGISLLYSKSANEHVRTYKRDEMRIDHEELVNYSSIKDLFKKIIHKQIADIFDLEGVYKPLSDTLSKEFINNHEEVIEGIVDSLKLKKRDIFQYANTNKPKNKKVLQDIFIKEIVKLVNQINAFITRDDVKKIIREFIPTLSENDISNIIRILEGDQALALEISSRVDFLVQSLNQNINNLAGTIYSTPKSGARIKGNPSNLISQHFPDFADNNLWSNLNNKYLSSSPTREALVGHKTQHTMRFIRESFRTKDSRFLQQSQSIMNALHKNGYLTSTLQEISSQFEDQMPDEDELPSELLSDISTYLREFIRISYVERKTLPLIYKFDLSDATQEEFTHKFLGSLRISNLSNKRNIKNFNDKISSKAEGASRFDGIKGWIFPSSQEDILDFQQFTLTSEPKRQDEVSNLASYKKIYEKLNSYKQDSQLSQVIGFVITDQLIADYLALIINGNHFIDNNGNLLLLNPGNKATPIIKRFLHDLTKLSYLMFGCESARNPSSLIHNIMAIDLIKKGIITLEQALSISWQDPSGGILPMTRTTPKDYETTIDLSRILHTIFFEYMPHSYLYDNKAAINPQNIAQITQVNNFIYREYWIFNLWVKNCLDENIKKKFLSYSADQQNTSVFIDNLAEFYRFMLDHFSKRLGNLDIENLWYTGDQINHLLHHLLPVANMQILAPVPLGNNIALINNIQTALNNLQTAAVLPLNLNNNHWVGLVLRRDTDGTMRAIYNDPMGNELTAENRNILEYYLRMYNNNNPLEVIDLHLDQQTNGYDCGPITVNNLVRLALAENLDFSSNREAIIQEAHLISTKNQDLTIRQRHSEILLMQRQANGEVNPNNIARLAELLNEERSFDQEGEPLNEQLANLALENITISQEEELIVNQNQINNQIESTVEDYVPVGQQPSVIPTGTPSTVPNGAPTYIPTSYTAIVSVPEDSFTRNLEIDLIDRSNSYLFFDMSSFW